MLVDNIKVRRGIIVPHFGNQEIYEIELSTSGYDVENLRGELEQRCEDALSQFVEQLKLSAPYIVYRERTVLEGEAELERDFEHELFQRPNPDSPKVERISLIFAALDKHRKARLNRALSEKYAIEDSDTPATYLIKNGSGRVFVTALTGDWGYCSCEDFQYRGARAGMPCKHLYALKMHLEAKNDEDQKIESLAKNQVKLEAIQKLDNNNILAKFRFGNEEKSAIYDPQKDALALDCPRYLTRYDYRQLGLQIKRAMSKVEGNHELQ